MNVWLAGIIPDKKLLAAISEAIEAEHALISTVTREEMTLNTLCDYDRNTAQFKDNIDCAVMELSTGRVYMDRDAFYVHSKGIPVLCLHRSDFELSPVLTYKERPGMFIRRYSTPEAAGLIVRMFLS